VNYIHVVYVKIHKYLHMVQQIFLTLTTFLDLYFVKIVLQKYFALPDIKQNFLRVCPFPTILNFSYLIPIKNDFRIQNVATVLKFNLYKKFYNFRKNVRKENIMSCTWSTCDVHIELFLY
jgi:hypothetical protein